MLRTCPEPTACICRGCSYNHKQLRHYKRFGDFNIPSANTYAWHYMCMLYECYWYPLSLITRVLGEELGTCTWCTPVLTWYNLHSAFCSRCSSCMSPPSTSCYIDDIRWLRMPSYTHCRQHKLPASIIYFTITYGHNVMLQFADCFSPSLEMAPVQATLRDRQYNISANNCFEKKQKHTLFTYISVCHKMPDYKFSENKSWEGRKVKLAPDW